MKKYILFLFVLLFPIHIPAHLLITTKCELIVKAENHKKKALYDLEGLEDKSWCIPDLSKREHLKAIIATCISTIPLKDPKSTLFYTGLAVIGSMAEEMYEEYCEMRTMLASATHHLDMELYYNQLSMQFPAQCNRDPWGDIKDLGTRSFLSAIDYLTMASMLTSCIEDKWTRMEISEELSYQRAELIKEFNNAPGKLSKKMSERGWTLLDNIDEVLAECSDEQLKIEIAGYIENMVWALENAEEKWKIN